MRNDFKICGILENNEINKYVLTFLKTYIVVRVMGS